MRTLQWLRAGGLATTVLVLIAATWVHDALANSSSFTWKMDKRLVSGKRNGRFHNLDAGALTLQGRIEITERLRGVVSTPIPVSIAVINADSLLDEVSCQMTVTPDTAVGASKAFSQDCGRVAAGKYWIRIKKNTEQNPDGDGWHNQGSATITTR